MRRFEMRTLREWIHRVRGTLNFGPRDSELEEELRLHRDLADEDARRRGLTPEEAMRDVNIRLGGASQALDAVRDQRSVPWVDDLVRDLGYGLRMLRRSPAFTAVALLTLALGIGANTAIYQLVDAIRLRMLPVKNPQQIAIVELADLTRWQGRRTTGYPVLTNPLWEHFRDHQQIFAGGVLAWSNVNVRLGRDTDAGSARGLFVSGEFFGVLGVEPLLGRVFAADDDRVGCGARGAVVSHGFWQRQLGGDPAVIGRTLALNSHPVEVIGVTAPGFHGLEVGRSYDVAVPICSHEELGGERGWLHDGSTWWLTVMGRMAPNQRLETVNAELAAASRGLFTATVPPDYRGQDADDYLGYRLRAVSGARGVSVLRTRYSDPLLLLLVTSAIVLLIACTNLANLILARASAREREFAVRLAIGASWSRLVRQLMVENGLLAIAGAAAGLVFAGALSRVLIGFLGSGLSLDLAFDARLIAFVIAMAVLTCLVFGLIPAWRASRVAAQDAMKASARSVTGSREGVGLRRALVISQVALSLVLLFGALLFAGTLRNLLAVDAGFEPDAVTMARVDFSRVQLPQEAREPLKRDLLERIRRVPGVSVAAEVRHVPLGGTGSSLTVWREGSDQARKTVRLNAISDGYLNTMGIGLISGRDFSARDSGAAPPVAIVNETFARRLGFSRNPVGERFRREGPTPQSSVAIEIIGLVPDTKYFTLREEFLPIAFVPIQQIADPRQFTDFMIRSMVPPGNVLPAVRDAIAGMSSLITTEFRTLDSTIRDGLLRERVLAALSGVFGTLAALIAAIGLYGVMSYLVQRRTNEIGVRIALGARHNDILVMVLREAAALLGIGLIVGSAFAFAAAPFAQSLVFGMSPRDIGPIGLACVLLATVATAASYLPARRAARLEPLSAFREV
jgi:predicted permease